jgi:hypothetical protein
MALRVDASQFTSIPRRSYDLKLLRVRIPSNYFPETRSYAAGAFLEAHSAADVAFNFLTIPAIVSGATMSTCAPSGEFWVDPGLGSFEYNTDATSWKVLDQDKKLVAQSSPSSPNLGTGKIMLPKLSSPQKWKLAVSGGSGRCALFVYPEKQRRFRMRSVRSLFPSRMALNFGTTHISNRSGPLYK